MIDLQREPRLVKVTNDDVSIHLFTRNNLYDDVKLSSSHVDDLKTSEFYNPEKTNVFLVHGLNNNRESKFNSILKAAILSQFDINLFILDWDRVAHTFYTNAKKAVPEIGKILSDYIKMMYTEFNLDGTNFKLIGHSLGAHICGVAGKNLDGKISHIAGLDPAGPLFTMENSDERLDIGDADFVGVTHTNAGFLGFAGSMGDADYYPNGGKTQRGCGLDLFGTCAHSRAYTYLAESILKSYFTAYRCDDYHKFEKGSCNTNDRSYMGRFHPDIT